MSTRNAWDCTVIESDGNRGESDYTGRAYVMRTDCGGSWWPQLAIVLVVFVGVGLAPLLAGQPLVMRDLGLWHGPVIRDVHGSQSWDGIVPYWTSDMGAGRAVLADGAYATLYPLSLLYGVLPFPLAFNLFILIHLLIAGVGMLLLARVLHVAPWPGAVAAVAYMLGGLTMSCAAQYPMIAGMALCPMVVAAGSTAVVRPSVRTVALTSGLLALQVMGGQPEPVIITVVLGIVWSLSELRRGWSTCVVPWLLSGVAAVGLAAPQWLPALLYIRETVRAWGYLDRAALFWSLHPARLEWLFLAGPSWDPMSRISRLGVERLVDSGVPLFDSLYMGLTVWVLAAVALFVRRRIADRGRHTRSVLIVLVAATAAVGIIISFGRHLSGVEWAFHSLRLALPFRYPVKALLLTSVSLPLLAALGIERICVGRSRSWRRIVPLLALLAVVADLGWAHRRMLWTASPDAMNAGRPLASYLHRESAVAGIPTLQWRLYHHRTPTGVRGPRVPEGLEACNDDWFRWRMALLMPLSGIMHGVSHGLEAAIHNLEPIQMYTWARELHSADHDRLVAGLGSMGVRWLLSHDPEMESSAPGLVTRVATLGENIGLPAVSAWLYRVETFVPRARVVTDWTVDGELSMHEFVDRLASSPGQPPVVLSSSPPTARPHPEIREIGWSVEILEETTGRLVVEASSEVPAVLLVSDVLLPGWAVRVNGNEEPIIRANGCFRAVEVPQGNSVVTFHYRPPGLVSGLAIAGATVLALLAASVVVGRRKPDV